MTTVWIAISIVISAVAFFGFIFCAFSYVFLCTRSEKPEAASAGLVLLAVSLLSPLWPLVFPGVFIWVIISMSISVIKDLRG